MLAMGDRDDIMAVKYRYLRALDTKKWGEYANTMTADVTGDYGSSVGEEHHFTEHHVTHPEITLDGDVASGIWYLQDRVIVPGLDFRPPGAALD
jgi:hypothetical protein